MIKLWLLPEPVTLSESRSRWITKNTIVHSDAAQIDWLTIDGVLRASDGAGDDASARLALENHDRGLVFAVVCAISLLAML